VLWGGAFGLLVLALAAVWWFGSTTLAETAPSSATGGHAPAGMPLPSGPADGAVNLSPRAPAGFASAPAPVQRTPGTATHSARPRLEDIQTELQALSAGGRTPQPQELDAVFEKLERYNGSSQMGGVDLQLIRKNLQAAARIQQLSEQMKPLAADPTPENVQKLQALVAEMRQAQASMDVKGLMAAASAMPGGKP
jgi:hypothetical protein